jgi:zinc protease
MAQAAPAIPDVPYEKFVLANGLTVLVHEDHKAPIVAVNVWYHVGSKNERRGKTGFAHLFEHLMFNGSEHFNDDYFKAMEKVGATDLNGTTNHDRTNYFQNVPTSALDFALFMESDRMGHLLKAIDQAKLDEQRGVVQNEKRQGENQPYGRVWSTLTENSYPAGHPYSWSVIGSMEDLTAASLDDVHEWFRGYYGPNNAVLSIAGDVTIAEAKAKVEKYFGDIPPGPPIAKVATWVAPMSGIKRSVMEDRVPQARVYKVWNVPPIGTPDHDMLDVATSVLSTGKSSRLYKRLVYDDQSATDVAAFIYSKEIGSQVIVQATVKPGGELAAVEKAVDEELARFLGGGPTAEEVERAKTGLYADLVRGLERIGGFGGKSDVLATGFVYTGDPHAYKKMMTNVLAATPEQVKQVAAKWLSQGSYVLEVRPFATLAAGAAGADRSALPDAGTPPAPAFPAYQTATLSNGLKVIVAERPAIPVVELNLLVNAGYAADAGGAPGTASLAMNMLDEGTATRTALQISDELERLGASLNVGSNLDASFVTLSALKGNLDASLALFADVVLNPSFPAADFERLKKQQLARIQREKVTPNSMGLRVLPQLLYGPGHAYAVPFTGSGTEAAVAALAREQLQAFHATWFKPNNATLVAVGATTLAELQPKLEKLFAAWKPGEVSVKNVTAVAAKPRADVYIIDRPGSQQSVVFAGVLAPPKNDERDLALQAFNYALGAEFTARINMNLREDKHWSYGAWMPMPDARGQRPYFVIAPVQGDKTADAVAEVVKELSGIVGDRPMTAEELTRAKTGMTLTLPGEWETNGAVLRSLAQMVQFDLPADYFTTYPGRINALELGGVDQAGKSVIRPENVVYVVVGDRAAIEPGIRALNLGEVKLLDADGNPVPKV